MSSMAALISVADGAILYNATYDGNNTTIRNFVNATAMKNDAAQTITSTAVNQLTLAYDGSHSGTFTVDVNGKLTLNATTTITVTPALTVTGAVTLSGSVTMAGAHTFTVAAATMQTTLEVDGNFSVNTTKFTVVAASGNTAVAGTLAVTGASTLTGTVNVGSDASVGTIKLGLQGADNASYVRFIGSNTNRNWEVSVNALSAGAFSITPSTALGGTTFSTAALQIAATGAVSMVGALAITGALTGATTGAFSGAVTTGTVNGQTISAVASLTGSLAVATTLGVTGASTLAAVTCTTLVASGAGSFGANPAVSGSLRIPNNDKLVGRNAANNGDIYVIGLDATNTVLVGSGNAVTVGGTLAVTGASTLAAVTCTTLGMTGALTGVTTIAASSTISGTVITASTALAAGGTVATIGDVRIKSNGAGIVGRNAANSADLTLLDLGATDVATVCRSTDLTLGNAALKIGFFGAVGATKSAVTGSRGGNAALASLLTALAGLGLLTDSSTA